MGYTLGDIEAGLQSRGFSFDQARGITAGIYGESGGNVLATNPTSGAFGLGQWLGARKAGLIATYGSNPTFDQQLDYLSMELRGGDAGGKHVLAATGQQNILQAYITKFMRPAAGKETSGDIARGTAYLTGNAQANKTIGDALARFGLGGVSNAVGTALAAPGDAIDAAATKLVGGLDPSQWFQRIAIAILAILLIGIALSMLAAKPVASIASKVPGLPV